MNINGWDVVYGCSQTLLNLRLEAAKEQFTFSFQTELSQIPIQAEFNDWKISSGGSNGSVVVLITSSGKIGSKISFDDMQSKVRIALSYVKKENGSGSISLDCGPGNVQVLELDCNNKLGLSDQDLLRDLLSDAYTQALEENSDKLSFILAKIEGFDSCGFQIKQFRYLWYEPISRDAPGFLLILGVTDDRDISQLPSIADHSLLYDSNGQAYHTVFMLSAEKFNSIFMLGAMPSFFAGSTANNYCMSGTNIANNGNIPLTPVKSGSITYDPYISSFNFHIDDNKAVTILYGKCPIKGLTNASVDFSLTAKNPIQFLPSNQTICFEEDPNLAITANKNIPSWEEWIGILSLGILNLVVDCVSASLENAITKGLSTYSVNAKSVGIQAVKWGVDLSIVAGGFSDHLYMQCQCV